MDPPGSSPESVQQLLGSCALRLLRLQLPDGCLAAIQDPLTQLLTCHLYTPLPLPPCPLARLPPLPPPQLRAGGPNILQWGPPGSSPESVQQLLGSCALRLLHPQLPDGCSAAAGDLLTQLLKSLGSCPPELVTAAAGKLGAGPSPRVVANLVPFFSRLALADSKKLLDLLASTTVEVKQSTSSGGGSGAQPALAAALPLLLEAVPDVVGTLATRQAAAALGALLAQRGHPALAGLMVKGPPLEAGGGGRVTRSTARRQGGLQYAQVGGWAGVCWVCWVIVGVVFWRGEVLEGWVVQETMR